MQSKREKFVRLAENRTTNALKQIELLGNLSNTRVYEYSDEDVEKIIKTLRTAVNELENSFKKPKKNTKFHLDDK